MDDKLEKLLELVPSFRRGELSPARAHEVAKALENNPEFAQEAVREELIVDVVSNFKVMPVPRKLVSRAVMQAVGEAPPKHWFSLDTLLIAIGVGVFCSAIAQLIASRLTLPVFSDWMLSLAALAANNATILYFGIILGAILMLGVGAWLALRVIRL